MSPFLILAINMLCHSMWFAEGQRTVTDKESQVTGLERKLEEYDEKFQLMVQSISNRIGKFESLLAIGFKQTNEFSAESLRALGHSLEEQDRKLQNLTKRVEQPESRLLEQMELLYQNLSSQTQKLQQSVLQVSSGLNQTLEEHDQTLKRVNQSLYREIQAVNELLDAVDLKLLDVYDCSDISARKVKGSGVYPVYVIQQQKRYRFDAYCDMKTTSGNWLVFQRRKDGSQNFTRGWTDYANGFGDLNGEFWLGNEFLYLLTSKRQYKLRIELENWTGEKRYAEYSNFSISSSADKYRLKLGYYSGTAGNSLYHHNGQRFTTYDYDNDNWHGNCALTHGGGGGWWYHASCHYSSLNGLYYFGGNYSSTTANGVEWYHWYNRWRYSFKTTEMKISPIA